MAIASSRMKKLFYTYIQLCSLGVLGLHSALEGMVYELYIRKKKEVKVTIGGKELTHKEFTNYGFERKLTTIAAQLSKKKNITGSKLLKNANEVKRLRDVLQHWDLEDIDSFFTDLPEDHPLKELVKINPVELSKNTREILDHYSLKN